MAIYFIADTHFGHQNALAFDNRRFKTIEEHDEAVITHWNETVQEDDDVYALGDLMLNDNERGLECLRRLNGRIHLVRGNHDTDARWKLYSELKNIVENLLHYPPPISFFSLLYRQIDHFSTFLPFYAPSFNNVSNQMLKFFFFSMFFLSLSLAFSTRLCYNKYILI